eukprot:ANDGO_07058.mRNA.1 hypothetical protein
MDNHLGSSVGSALPDDAPFAMDAQSLHEAGPSSPPSSSSTSSPLLLLPNPPQLPPPSTAIATTTTASAKSSEPSLGGRPTSAVSQMVANPASFSQLSLENDSESQTQDHRIIGFIRIVEQSRAPRACLQCRAVKRACDAAMPSCSRCVQRGIEHECTYVPRRPRLKKKEKELEREMGRGGTRRRSVNAVGEGVLEETCDEHGKQHSSDPDSSFVYAYTRKATHQSPVSDGLEMHDEPASKTPRLASESPLPRNSLSVGPCSGTNAPNVLSSTLPPFPLCADDLSIVDSLHQLSDMFGFPPISFFSSPVFRDVNDPTREAVLKQLRETPDAKLRESQLYRFMIRNQDRIPLESLQIILKHASRFLKVDAEARAFVPTYSDALLLAKSDPVLGEQLEAARLSVQTFRFPAFIIAGSRLYAFNSPLLNVIDFSREEIEREDFDVFDLVDPLSNWTERISMFLDAHENPKLDAISCPLSFRRRDKQRVEYTAGVSFLRHSSHRVLFMVVHALPNAGSALEFAASAQSFDLMM